MYRRSLVTGLCLSPLAMVDNAWAGPAVPNRGTIVFGAARGAIGSKLAEATLERLRRSYQMDYALVINDTRSSRAAAEAVHNATPDGTTLLQAQSSSIVMFPSTYQALEYDPVKDFAPLTLLSTYGYSLVLGAAVPAGVKTVQGYLDWVQGNPDLRDVGFTFYGSQAHLLGMMLAREGGVAVRPQGYGSAESLFRDLAAGNLAAGFAVSGNVPLLAGNGVRPVAITDSQRVPRWPQVSTFSEAGLAPLNLTGWYGWFAPAGTPPAVVNTQSANLCELTETPEYSALLETLVMRRNTDKPPQIAALMQREIAQYAQLAKSYRLSVAV